MKLGTINSHERKRIAGKKKVNEFRDGFKILIYMIMMPEKRQNIVSHQAG